jgi:hypothetical protein
MQWFERLNQIYLFKMNVLMLCTVLRFKGPLRHLEERKHIQNTMCPHPGATSVGIVTHNLTGMSSIPASGPV